MKEIQQLLTITNQLRSKYGRNFTLDGKLVGDIGEVLAKEKYDLTLLPENTPVHDAKQNSTGKLVQIKSTFKGNFIFPAGKERIPDYLLCIQILPNGSLEEIYNGTGKFVFEEYILKKNLKAYRNSYYTLSMGILKQLNLVIDKNEKVEALGSNAK